MHSFEDIPKRKGILTYHSLACKVTASKVPKLRVVKTPTLIPSRLTKHGLKFNGAIVTTTDVEASHGVIHIIC